MVALLQLYKKIPINTPPKIAAAISTISRPTSAFKCDDCSFFTTAATPTATKIINSCESREGKTAALQLRKLRALHIDCCTATTIKSCKPSLALSVTLRPSIFTSNCCCNVAPLPFCLHCNHSTYSSFYGRPT